MVDAQGRYDGTQDLTHSADLNLDRTDMHLLHWICGKDIMSIKKFKASPSSFDDGMDP
jgi:hypothetical protein